MDKKVIILIFVFLITSCSLRISSKKRFSKAFNIQMPKDRIIINDKYQNMGQDYAVIYHINISKKNCIELLDNIKKKNKSERIRITKTNNGYIINKNVNHKEYSVKIDTIHCSAKFKEESD